MLDELLSLVTRSRRDLTLFLVFMRFTMVGRERAETGDSHLLHQVGTYPRDYPLLEAVHDLLL